MTARDQRRNAVAVLAIVRREIYEHVADATHARGGRRKKYYRLEPAGAEALRQSYSEIQRMAAGLGPKLAEPLPAASD